jgi:hypothetical protein
MNTKIGFLLDQWLRYRLRIAITVLCLIACGWLTYLWITSYYSPSGRAILSWKGMLTVIGIVKIPHLLVVLLLITLAVLPWVRWSRRYSLRTFLVIVTLLALLLGALVTSN